MVKLDYTTSFNKWVNSQFCFRDGVVEFVSFNDWKLRKYKLEDYATKEVVDLRLLFKRFVKTCNNWSSGKRLEYLMYMLTIYECRILYKFHKRNEDMIVMLRCYNVILSKLNSFDITSHHSYLRSLMTDPIGEEMFYFNVWGIGYILGVYIGGQNMETSEQMGNTSEEMRYLHDAMRFLHDAVTLPPKDSLLYRFCQSRRTNKGELMCCRIHPLYTDRLCNLSPNHKGCCSFYRNNCDDRSSSAISISSSSSTTENKPTTKNMRENNTHCNKSPVHHAKSTIKFNAKAYWKYLIRLQIKHNRHNRMMTARNRVETRKREIIRATCKINKEIRDANIAFRQNTLTTNCTTKQTKHYTEVPGVSAAAKRKGEKQISREAVFNHQEKNRQVQKEQIRIEAYMLRQLDISNKIQRGD